MTSDPLLQALIVAPELASLCTQNGWIDDDTLSYEIIEEKDECWLLVVQFDEIIMEGSGCVAGRIPCYGRVRLMRRPNQKDLIVEIV